MRAHLPLGISAVLLFIGSAVAEESQPPPENDQPPVLESVVADQPVVESKTTEVGGRTVTIERVVPGLRPEAPPPPDLSDPEVQAAAEATRQRYVGFENFAVSATVYDNAHTLVRWWPLGHQEQEAAAWLNVDFRHLAGKDTFFHGGRRFRISFGIGEIDTTKEAQRAVRLGRAYTPPVIPEFASTAPTALAASGTLSAAAVMAPVEAILDAFRSEGTQMQAAYEEKRRQAAERKALIPEGPQEPEDVVIRYWRRGGKPLPTQSND